MDKVISEIQARHDFAMAANEQFGLWNPERVMEAHKDRHTLLTKIEQLEAENSTLAFKLGNLEQTESDNRERIKQLEAVRDAAEKFIDSGMDIDRVDDIKAALAAVENGEVL